MVVTSVRNPVTLMSRRPEATTGGAAELVAATPPNVDQTPASPQIAHSVLVIHYGRFGNRSNHEPSVYPPERRRRFMRR